MQLTKQNWPSVWQEIQVKADNSQIEVLRMQTPALSSVNAGTGSVENSRSVLSACILMLLEFYGMEWSELQIDEMAEIWSREYYWMHIAEIKHFMSKCKSGAFGKIFGKFSPAVLVDWLSEYTANSLNLRAQEFERAHDRVKYQNEKERAANPGMSVDQENAGIAERLKNFTVKISKDG